MSNRRRSVIKKIWDAIIWCFRAIAKLISALFILSLIVSLIMMIWMFRDTSRPPEVLPDTVLVMPLEGLIIDGPPVDATTQRLLGEHVQTVQELVRTLRKAAFDDRIVGILLKPGPYSMNLTAALDLREELLAFRQTGKRIFAYTETLWMGSYLLTSVADQIFMPPSGSTFVMGLRAEVAFYHGLFQKLGVTPEFVAIGNYKLAPQVYTMDHMSDEFREVLNEQLDAYYAAYLHNIADARQVSVLQAQQWIDDALYTTQDALEAGMIDAIVYESQLEDRLALELGLTEENAVSDDVEEQPQGHDADSDTGAENTAPETTPDDPASDDSSLLTTLTVSEYGLVDVDAPKLHVEGEKIAVVYASGIISTGKSAPSASQPSIGSDSLGKLFTSLAEDDDIRGIIVRIDSGGGGAMASDIIRNSLQEATEKKPVVVSMADVAASGGYMIALPADRIVAHPLTLTGSIGIFGGKFSLKGLSDLVGVRVETMQRGRNAGLFTTSRVQTPEEQERFRRYLQQRYDEFVAQVAQGREMAATTAQDVAQGRVWTGEQAIELGLVDALGGLETAIDLMKELLDIPELDDVAVVPYPRPGNLLEVLQQRVGDWLKIPMSAEIREMNQHFDMLMRLQNEQVFAWWPARIRID